MTPKKRDFSAYSSFIERGVGELAKQTPEMRGIKVPPTKKTQPNRERFTVNLPPDLIEWGRRAVVNTLGLTLTALIEEALTRELERREAKNGGPFPTTTETPKKGRPVKLKG